MWVKAMEEKIKKKNDGEEQHVRLVDVLMINSSLGLNESKKQSSTTMESYKSTSLG